MSANRYLAWFTAAKKSFDRPADARLQVHTLRCLDPRYLSVCGFERALRHTSHQCNGRFGGGRCGLRVGQSRLAGHEHGRGCDGHGADGQGAARMAAGVGNG